MHVKIFELTHLSTHDDPTKTQFICTLYNTVLTHTVTLTETMRKRTTFAKINI